MSKLIRFCGIPIYELYEKEFLKEQRIFGITVRRKYLDINGWNKSFLGILYRRTPVATKLRTQPCSLPPAISKELRHKEPKEVLLLMPPGIGDYIHIRNFLAELKASDRFKGARIIAVGNDNNKSLAEYLDDDVIDQWLSYGPRLHSPSNPNFVELACAKARLRKRGMRDYYHTIIYIANLFGTIDQRKLYAHLLNGVASEERIGFCPADKNYRAEEYLYDTQVVLYHGDVNKTQVFEIARYFFESILDKKISIPYPFIDTTRIKPYAADSKYIVVAPCGSSKKRMWHLHNWREMFLRIRRQADVNIAIVCSKGEKKYCSDMQAELATEGISAEIYAGLNAPDLLSLLKGSACCIAMDSGVFHIATCMGVKTICIAPGSSYQRWLAYTEKQSHVCVVSGLMGSNLIARGSEPISPAPDATLTSYTYINAIRVDDVVNAVSHMLTI